MPLRTRTIAAGIALTAMLAACGSSATPAPATAGAGSSLAPVASQSSAAVNAPSGSGAAASLPALPSFAGDPTLAAHFPAQVGGNPVTSVNISSLVAFYAALQTPQDEIDSTRQKLAAVGIDINTVIIGTASATVNGSTVGIEALRVPGIDASTLIKDYAVLSPLDSGDTLKQESVGGKTVSVVRDQGGYASTWLYASGDILWQVNTSDEKEATAVFSALQ